MRLNFFYLIFPSDGREWPNPKALNLRFKFIFEFSKHRSSTHALTTLTCTHDTHTSTWSKHTHTHTQAHSHTCSHTQSFTDYFFTVKLNLILNWKAAQHFCCLTSCHRFESQQCLIRGQANNCLFQKSSYIKCYYFILSKCDSYSFK